jgi:hypothetical protein
MYLAIFGLLVGALLATRFRATALCPAILIVTPIVAVRGIATGYDAKALAVAVIVAAAALQVGYVMGCVLRATLAPPPGADDRVALPT